MEIWKDVVGYEGLYQVSNLGNVKSLARKRGSCFGKEKILNVSFTKCGYKKVNLSSKGKQKTFRVHQLVAMMFLDNPSNKDTINHIDGNKENNKVDNLEYSTRSEQLKHAYSMNLRSRKNGTLSSNSKLKTENIEYIRSVYTKGSREFGSVALGKKFNVSHRVILLVANNKTYN